MQPGFPESHGRLSGRPALPPVPVDREDGIRSSGQKSSCAFCRLREGGSGRLPGRGCRSTVGWNHPGPGFISARLP